MLSLISVAALVAAAHVSAGPTSMTIQNLTINPLGAKPDVDSAAHPSLTPSGHGALAEQPQGGHVPEGTASGEALSTESAATAGHTEHPAAQHQQPTPQPTASQDGPVAVPMPEDAPAPMPALYTEDLQDFANFRVTPLLDPEDFVWNWILATDTEDGKNRLVLEVRSPNCLPNESYRKSAIKNLIEGVDDGCNQYLAMSFNEHRQAGVKFGRSCHLMVWMVNLETGTMMRIKKAMDDLEAKLRDRSRIEKTMDDLKRLRPTGGPEKADEEALEEANARLIDAERKYDALIKDTAKRLDEHKETLKHDRQTSQMRVVKNIFFIVAPRSYDFKSMFEALFDVSGRITPKVLILHYVGEMGSKGQDQTSTA